MSLVSTGRHVCQTLPSPQCRNYPQRIPAEIWIQIFESSVLRRTDIAKLTVVCQCFRRLSQPLLFEEISITIVVDTDQGESFCQWQGESHHAAFLQRLQFISSEHISTAVRILILRSFHYYHQFPQEYVTEESQALAHLFDTITRLHNVHTIAAHSVVLTVHRVEQLAQLPRLAHLHLYQPRIPITALPQLRLKSFSLFGDISSKKTSGSWWGSLLCSSTIEHLCLAARTRNADADGIQGLVTIEPWCSLRVLRLHPQAAREACFVDALSSCTAIEELILSDPCPEYGGLHLTEGEFPTLPIKVLPCLRAITAPKTFLLSNVGGRPMRSINVASCLTSILDVQQLLEDLGNLCPKIEELTLTMTTFQTSLLAALFRLFRHVRCCDIRIDLLREGEDMIECLKVIDLPSTLESLHVVVGSCGNLKPLLDYEFQLLRSRSQSSNVLRGENRAQITARMMQKCPNLKDILVICPQVKIFWHGADTTGIILKWEDWTRGYRPRYYTESVNL